MCATLTNSTSTLKSLQARFLVLLPRIESQARIYFRGIRCRTKKADCVAEVVAICWKWFCRLARRGKDATQFVGALAALAARAIWSGRRAHRSESTADVMSSVAQRRHGFTVQPFPPVRQSHETLYGTGRGQQIQDAIEERLVDNTVTPVPEQARQRNPGAGTVQAELHRRSVNGDPMSVSPSERDKTNPALAIQETAHLRRRCGHAFVFVGRNG
jgi:hypothetical protein